MHISLPVLQHWAHGIAYMQLHLNIKAEMNHCRRQDFSPLSSHWKVHCCSVAKLQISSSNVEPDIYVHRSHHAYRQRIPFKLHFRLLLANFYVITEKTETWFAFSSFGGMTPTENKWLLFQRVLASEWMKDWGLLCYTTRLCNEWSLDVTVTKNKYICHEVLCLCVSITHFQVLRHYHNRSCASTSQPLL